MSVRISAWRRENAMIATLATPSMRTINALSRINKYCLTLIVMNLKMESASNVPLATTSMTITSAPRYLMSVKISESMIKGAMSAIMVIL